MKKDGCADRCYGRVAVGIVVFVAIFLSVIQALHALESVFPLTVGKKWIYAYEYREETECSLYDFPPYNEEGVIYLEVISNRLQAGTDVYTVRKTIKSDQGVVGTYAVDLFENSEGLKESPSGSVIVHYRQPSWSDYTYLFADSGSSLFPETGSDNRSFLSGPELISVASMFCSAYKVSMTFHYEPEIYFPAPVAIDIASAEWYAERKGLVRASWTKTVQDSSPPVCDYTYHTEIALVKEVPAGEDVYEDDNGFARASPIAVSAETQPHTFHSASDVDFVAFAAGENRTYSIETSRLGDATDTEVTLYDTDGTTVLSSDDDGGGGGASRIVYSFSSAGTYYVSIEDKNHEARGEYDVAVREISSALYFPHVVSDERWATGIACVNRADADAVVTMTGYNAAGSPLGNASAFPGASGSDYRVMGEEVPNCPFVSVMGKTGNLLSGYFPDNEPTDIDWVRVVSDQPITGFTAINTRSLDRLAAVPAARNGARTLYFPYAASDSSWSSTIALVNIDTESATVTIEGWDENGAVMEAASGPVTLHPGEKLYETVAALFGAAAPMVASVKITSTQELTGLLLLEHRADPLLAGEPACTEGAGALYFPHVFDHPQWECRTAIVNSAQDAAHIAVAAYDDDGIQVGVHSMVVPARGRFFGDPAELFGGTLPGGAAYLKVTADTALMGFNLFATTDGKQVAGVRASSTGSRTFSFPHVAADHIWTTGLAMINTGAGEALVTITAYDKSGNALETAQNHTRLAAGGKVADRVINFFSGNALPEGATSLLVEATQPLVAFEIFRTLSGSEMAGFTVTGD